MKRQALADLSAQVGSETFVSDWHEVAQERIALFAEATGDHQWIHVDVERASRESPYGAPVAHGFLTLSLIPMLTSEVSGGGASRPGVKLSVNYGLDRVRFPAPVRAGDRVRARVRLEDVREVPGGLQLTRMVTIEVEGGDKPACVATMLGRLYFEENRE